MVPKPAEKRSQLHDSCTENSSAVAEKQIKRNLTSNEEGLPEGSERDLVFVFVSINEATWNETFLSKFSKIVQNNSVTCSEPLVKIIPASWPLNCMVSFI